VFGRQLSNEITFDVHIWQGGSSWRKCLGQGQTLRVKVTGRKVLPFSGESEVEKSISVSAVEKQTLIANANCK